MMSRKVLFMVLMSLCWAAWPYPAPDGETDTSVHTRLYRGERNATAVVPAVSSREIDSLSQADEAYHAGQAEEAAKIRRIYNLTDLNLVNQGAWQWREGMPKRLVKVFRFQKNSMAIRMVHESQDRFSLRVSAGEDISDPGREMLASTFDIGVNRTTVFGFNDEEGNPWFLSFHHSVRHQSSGSGNDAQPDKRVIPSYYPQQALDKRIEGNVVLTAALAENGGIQEDSLQIVEGDPLLRDTAVSAFREMGQLAIPKAQQRPKAVVFLFMFRLQRDEAHPVSHADEIDRFKQSPGYLRLEGQLREAGLQPWIMKAVLIVARCQVGQD